MEESDDRRHITSNMPHYLQDLHSEGETDVCPSTWPGLSVALDEPSAPPTRYVPDPALFVTPEKHTKQTYRQGLASTMHEVPLRFTSMLDGDDEDTWQPRVRFNHTVKVKEVSPESSTQEKKTNTKHSMDQVKDDLVGLSGLANSSSKTVRQHNKCTHSKDKQYSYPLGNFMNYTQSSKAKDVKNSQIIDPISSCAFEALESSDFLYNGNEEDVEFTVEREPQSRLGHHVWGDSSPKTDEVEMETVLPEGCSDRPWENPVSAFVTATKTTSHSHAKILDTGECVLNRPELNSTLWMNADLQQLRESELDLTSALEQKLKIPRTKAKVAEKVYTRLNVNSPAFPSSPLVGVDVIEEEIVDIVSKQKAAKAKQTHKRKFLKAEDQLERKPDLMEYFTPELQKETACLSLRSEPLTPRGLSTAEMDRTFDLYKHIRSWEGY